MAMPLHIRNKYKTDRFFSAKLKMGCVKGNGHMWPGSIEFWGFLGACSGGWAGLMALMHKN